MSDGILRVYVASDDALEDIREFGEAEGIEVLDMRTPWQRAKHFCGQAMWGLLGLYFFIAHYHQFKVAVGLAQEVCK